MSKEKTMNSSVQVRISSIDLLFGDYAFFGLFYYNTWQDGFKKSGACWAQSSTRSTIWCVKKRSRIGPIAGSG
uniref:Uncharacterized protein n=1 Tax=Pristionchus pacificus TaxID=54126 RepID=A0A2A6BBI4_PRIPA|eukprot:PDM63201.1 hypothetical protein PRIPAC_50416 [Pristionchus pacificus]